MCPCGECTEVLNTCDCPTADELTALIEKKLSQGQPKEQIIQYFVAQYGEQVPKTPTNPQSEFNLRTITKHTLKLSSNFTDLVYLSC